MGKPLYRALLWAAVAAAGLAGAGAALAPYVYAEYAFDWHGGTPQVQPMPTVPVHGRWVDDYFVVEPLDAGTIAIGEPRYYQGNYSYLILGASRAVLFDAGSGLKDIAPLVRSLTSLPVTVIPSHLHFDHVGALGRFDKTALLDHPSLKARAVDSRITLERYEFLGFADRLPTKTFKVDEWWANGATIDLGGRRLRVLETPGHTETSVSLYDADSQQLFAGDFLYPSYLYAFLPGASRSAYLATTRQLRATLAAQTRIYGAHMQGPPAPVQAPALQMADLARLEQTLGAIDQGTAASVGVFPRKFEVGGDLVFLTSWPWNNR